MMHHIVHGVAEVHLLDCLNLEFVGVTLAVHKPSVVALVCGFEEPRKHAAYMDAPGLPSSRDDG